MQEAASAQQGHGSLQKATAQILAQVLPALQNQTAGMQPIPGGDRSPSRDTLVLLTTGAKSITLVLEAHPESQGHYSMFPSTSWLDHQGGCFAGGWGCSGTRAKGRQNEGLSPLSSDYPVLLLRAHHGPTTQPFLGGWLGEQRHRV